jgi:hypothetical protein
VLPLSPNNIHLPFAVAVALPEAGAHRVKIEALLAARLKNL